MFIISDQNYYSFCDGKCGRCTEYLCESCPNSPGLPLLDNIPFLLYDPCDGKCYMCNDLDCENNPRCPDRSSLDELFSSSDLSEFDCELPF